MRRENVMDSRNNSWPCAGTTQALISRIENDKHSPTVETLRGLLLVMGEDLKLDSKQLDRDYDPIHMAAESRKTPSERLALSLEWTRFNDLVRSAGKKARAEARDK